MAILSRGNHDPAVPPGRLIVLNLFYIGFIGYVMLFALSQVIRLSACRRVCVYEWVHGNGSPKLPC